MKLEIDLIKSVMKKKGYAFFENGSYNLNIVGIRSDVRTSGSFDDFISVIYKNDLGQWNCLYWKATTDAGTYWLQNPMNSKGTALLVPNQYRGCFKIGLHKNQYEALVQHKEVSVYRDNNRDKIIDFNAATIDKGMFGINIHRSNPSKESVLNDKWSAGCQVFASPSDFKQFMSVIKLSSIQFGDIFTYTLLTQNDFNV